MTNTETSSAAGEVHAVAADFYRAYDDGDPERLARVVAPGVVDHDPMPGSPGGREGLEALLGLVAQAFADRRHELLSVDAIGDDRGVVVWRMTGRHVGEFLGVPPTGRNVAFKGIDVFRIEDGRIVEQHHVEQLLQARAQLADAA